MWNEAASWQVHQTRVFASCSAVATHAMQADDPHSLGGALVTIMAGVQVAVIEMEATAKLYNAHRRMQ